LIFCFLPFQDFEIRRTDENKDKQHDFLQYDDPATAAENSKNQLPHVIIFVCVKISLLELRSKNQVYTNNYPLANEVAKGYTHTHGTKVFPH
jgi:hypothetical protein